MKPIMPIGGWYLRVSPRMITCREFNDFIYDYTEGLLSEKQLKLFERHMRVCPMCRNFLKTYSAAFKTGALFFPNSDQQVPNSVPEDLIAAISDINDS
ncbi:MAG: zf-HC2 domain-containing protein [Gammaproteobacteria bacterium]|nr:zf-HC2 domain-containing protein [Gammaproteobacteria bacterium]